MTWEETIQYIRTKPEFSELVEKAYFETNLPLNVERFKSDLEFVETLSLIKQLAPDAKKILDVGSGNGISAVAFALNGYEVTACEPDPSKTIGAGAIRQLKSHYNLSNLTVIEEFAEKINMEGVAFDLVYVRQAMHHAYDLNSFVKNISHLIKPQGFLFTVRDHVILGEQDKQWFLETHPLHKFYGGENAFTFAEYKDAIENAGLHIIKVMRHFESVINYFPLSKTDFEIARSAKEKDLENILRKKIGILGDLPFLKKWYYQRNGLTDFESQDERKVPGRMYSFIAQKK